jgi:hypothetical protein
MASPPDSGDDGGDDGRPADEPKVKDLLDPATRAQLERWFSLPSFEQLADRGVVPAEPPPEDTEASEQLKRRAAAIEAADPTLLAEIAARAERSGDAIKPLPPLPSPTDRPIAQFDPAMAELRTIAEPRDYERAMWIEDDLKDCTPQALLRDLHRPELLFDKVFERFDPDAQARFNVRGIVTEVMTTRWQNLDFPLYATALARDALSEVRTTLHQPWADLQIPHRTEAE